jgi:putative copper resistance protein D
VASFVDVLLRGAGLAAQSVVLGGVVFVLFVLRTGRPGALAAPLGRHIALIAGGAVGVALAQAAAIGIQLVRVAGDGTWPLADLLATTYVRAALLRGVACVGLVAVAIRGGARGTMPLAAPLVFALLLAGSSAWLSHAAARVGSRGVPLVLDAAHQLAAAMWIGGLAHLTVAAVGRGDRAWAPALLRRFSHLALVSVAVLIAAGVTLGAGYVGSLDALVGTSYGLLLLTKGILLLGMLGLGALAVWTVRRAVPDGSLVGARRLAEVELGLGLTVLFVAASLTSIPPAVDVRTERVPIADVLTRLTPRWPSLRSPEVRALPTDREAPRTAEDEAWSEFNHHVAGLVVLVMGGLAAWSAGSGSRVARHWPLLMLGLGAFVLVRSDPEAWPLGPGGFWASLRDPEVLQHRAFVVLVVAFAVVEWLVRWGRLRAPGWAYVFPLVFAAGAGLLLAHSHARLDLQREFLMEIAHVPLGLLGLVVAWARWLELRLPPPGNRLPGRVWPIAMMLAGLLLVFYRES